MDEILGGIDQQCVARLQDDLADLAFDLLATAVNGHDRGLIPSTEIGLLDRHPHEW